VIAELTDDGLERLRVASRTHLAGVGRHFIDRFDERELEELTELCDRLAGASADQPDHQPDHQPPG
jgi:hypothetical protein